MHQTSISCGRIPTAFFSTIPSEQGHRTVDWRDPQACYLPELAWAWFGDQLSLHAPPAGEAGSLSHFDDCELKEKEKEKEKEAV
jgi:hypothetical protein